MRRIFWAGDSTVKANKYDTFPQTGIGQAMPVYLENDVVICNHAENGRSTKSFIDEGRLERIEQEIGEGDYLFIQFGHNDEKEDPERFTGPFGAYQENLKKMIDTARSHKAYPVLITPLYRRLFNEDGDLIRGTHLEYPAAMKELAEREQVPCIDLCSLSFDVIQREGEAKSRRWFMYFPEGMYPAYADGKEDNTHLRYEGAVRFAGLIAEGLNGLGDHYRKLLVKTFRREEAAEEKRIVVAQDGSGDYRNIQEAAASVGADNCQPVRIYIKDGVYKERLEITAPFLTLEGESAENTIITYDRYGKMEMEDGMKRGTFRSYSVFVNTHDFTAKNLTFENSSGLGEKVGQALALYVDGDRIVFDGCRLLASQDTLFTGPLPPKEIEKNGFIGPKQYDKRVNGRHYYKNCLIRGDIDFIFGSATAFFKGCEIFSQDIGKEINGYATAASTPEGQEYGYVFQNCRFTGNCPPESAYLGRPWRNYAKTVILNSEIGEHICREGWHDWGKTEARATVFYAEYGNTGAGADMSGRPEWIVRLTKEEAEQFGIERVLAGNDGWNPQ